MSGMRLIVAGAGGRMGRTLIQAIAASKDATLAGAVDAPGSAVGRDAGELAGLGKTGTTVGTDVEPLLASADGLLDFTIPAATIAYAELAARHGRVHEEQVGGPSPRQLRRYLPPELKLAGTGRVSAVGQLVHETRRAPRHQLTVRVDP